MRKSDPACGLRLMVAPLPLMVMELWIIGRPLAPNSKGLLPWMLSASISSYVQPAGRLTTLPHDAVAVLMAWINWPTSQPGCCTEKATEVSPAGPLPVGWGASMQPGSSSASTRASVSLFIESPVRRGPACVDRDTNPQPLRLQLAVRHDYVDAVDERLLPQGVV